MTVHTFDIELENDDVDDPLNIKLSQHFSDDNQDTTYITLKDTQDDPDEEASNTWQFHLTNFGFGRTTEYAEEPGDDGKVYVDLETFDDDTFMSVHSMDPGDRFLFNHAECHSIDSNVYTFICTGTDGEPCKWVIDIESSGDTDVASIVITCFVAGTVIETYHGPCAVEDLDIGDRVLCGDGQHRLIQWIATRHVPNAELTAHPEFRPIRFCQGSLGHNLPNKDLLVSPQHRILVSNWRAELMFGPSEVLIPAKYMVNDGAIFTDWQTKEVTYFHFMFDSHQTVMSNGLETESFHPCETALTGVEIGARDELFSLFPGLLANPESFGPTCLPTLKKFEAETLLSAI